jgi:hypothetical protein
VAWIGTIALSSVPEVLLVEAGVDRSAIVWIWLATVGLLSLSTHVWPAARPLRPYFIMMTAVIGLAHAIRPWLSDLISGPERVGLSAFLWNRLMFVALTLVMAAVLTKGMGMSRQSAFLSWGDMTAAWGGRSSEGGRRRRVGSCWAPRQCFCWEAPLRSRCGRRARSVPAASIG